MSFIQNSVSIFHIVVSFHSSSPSWTWHFLPMFGSFFSVCRCSRSELWGCSMKFPNSSVWVVFALDCFVLTGREWSPLVTAAVTCQCLSISCWGTWRVVVTFYAWKSFIGHHIVCLCNQNMYINWNENFKRIFLLVCVGIINTRLIKTTKYNSFYNNKHKY